MSLVEKIEKIKQLANYCFSCNACNTVCPTHYIGTFSPRKFLQQLIETKIENIDEFIQKQDLFNCLTCMQCWIYCPMATEKDGVNFATIIQELRSYGIQHNLIQKSLETHQTHDNMMQILPKIQAETPSGINKIDDIKNNPSLKTIEKGEIAFFIGCAEAMEAIFYTFDINYSKSASSSITILNRCGIIPVVLPLKCCGHDAYWTGDTDIAKKLAEYNIQQYRQAGVKTIIVECAEGYRMWKYDYPKLCPDVKFTVLHLSEFLTSNEQYKQLSFKTDHPIKVTYHDPCRLGRLGGKVYTPPRNLLQNIRNVELLEMSNNKENAQCCGVSTFHGCNGSTHRLREVRMEEASKTGAEYFITTCPKCITHFNCFQSEIDDDGKVKTKSSNIQIIDLASFLKTYLK